MAERKNVNFRASLEEIAKIEALAKAEGLTKQEYLLQAALRGLAPIDDTTLASVVASQQRTIEMLTEQLSKCKQFDEVQAGLNVYTAIDTTKSASSLHVGGVCDHFDTRDLLHDASAQYGDFVLSRGFLWMKDKNANGNVLKLKAIAEVPSELAYAIDSEDLPKVKKAVESYQLFTSLAGYDQLPLKSKRGYARECLKGTSIEEELGYAKQEIADITPKPVEAETITVTEVESACTPDITLISPMDNPSDIRSDITLDKAAFMARYGLDPNDNSYSTAVQAVNSNGYWAASDGTHWQMVGKGKKAVWTQLAIAEVA